MARITLYIYVICSGTKLQTHADNKETFCLGAQMCMIRSDLKVFRSLFTSDKLTIDLRCSQLAELASGVLCLSFFVFNEICPCSVHNVKCLSPKSISLLPPQTDVLYQNKVGVFKKNKNKKTHLVTPIKLRYKRTEGEKEMGHNVKNADTLTDELLIEVSINSCLSCKSNGTHVSDRQRFSILF